MCSLGIAAASQISGVTGVYRDIGQDTAIRASDAEATVLRTTVFTMGWLFLALTGFIVVADVTTNQSRRRQMAERERMEKARIEQATAVARAEELRHSRTRMVAVSESLRREIAQHLHGSVQNKLILLLHRIKELGGTAPSEQLAKEL